MNMKTVSLIISLGTLIFTGCANGSADSKNIVVNNIPPKTTSVKAEKPFAAPSNRSGYYGGYYGHYGYYRLGNGPIGFQGSPEDIDNQVRGVD
jgi:hypothetical protein